MPDISLIDWLPFQLKTAIVLRTKEAPVTSNLVCRILPRLQFPPHNKP